MPMPSASNATTDRGALPGHQAKIRETIGAVRTCSGSTTRRNSPKTASAPAASISAAAAATGTSSSHRHRSRAGSQPITVRRSRIKSIHFVTGSDPLHAELMQILPRCPRRVQLDCRMQDLTTGSLTGHLLKTTSFMLVSMIFQTLYILVDLFWVGRLGTDAIAAVGLAANLSFVVIAITQVLGVGATTLVSHASGRKDQDRAIFLFNQSQVLSAAVAVVFLAITMLL